ncbi:MAG TPA: nitroreductase family protein [Steroidobacteraceae bacterium]|jgi:nitroreductase|nr:nitroreductase family protein [Steroidobacteraceae bacterium]
MDITAAISGRRSTREYTEQTLDEQTIRLLIHAATLAPSAVNQQPWTFTVVQSQDVLDRLSRDAKAHMLATMSADLGGGGHAEHFRSILSDPAFQIFYHAPALILISGNAAGSWITEDCALAAENLMLMAHALGLGTCWIGFAQNYLNTLAGKRQLGLPESWVPVAPLIVGFPKTSPPAVPRKDPEIRWVN